LGFEESEAIMKGAILISVGLFASLILHGVPPTAGAQGSSLDKIYQDETHCLTRPEIRSEKDSPISCYCRDAIVDARYVWHTYLITTGPRRDPNLNGTELTLQINATQMCGEQYDVHKAVNAEDWKWNGPEVSRTSPPDDVLRQIKPDSHGMIHYDYTVVLLKRDSSGRAVNTESYTAHDMVPLEFLTKESSKSPAPKRQE
jgi:hypothetical protein